MPVFAEDAGKTAGSNQQQTVPVQPERSPQQSEQSREADRTRAEDVQVGRDWRTQQRDGDRMGRMDRNNMGRMMDQDSEHRAVGRGWRMRHDADDRGYSGATQSTRNLRGPLRRPGALMLEALEHSSSLSPSASAAPQCRQARADIATDLPTALRPS